MAIATPISSMSNSAGSVQGQAGWDFEQPDVGKDVPAHGGGLGLDDL